MILLRDKVAVQGINMYHDLRLEVLLSSCFDSWLNNACFFNFVSEETIRYATTHRTDMIWVLCCAPHNRCRLKTMDWISLRPALTSQCKLPTILRWLQRSATINNSLLCILNKRNDLKTRPLLYSMHSMTMLQYSLLCILNQRNDLKTRPLLFEEFPNDLYICHRVPISRT